MIIAAVFWLISAAVVTIFVVRAWSMSRRPVLTAHSRGQLVRSGIDAVVALALVRALFPPPGWTSWLWVVAAAAVGFGVAGVIINWSRWPTGGRRWTTAVYALVGAGLVIGLA